MLPKTSDSWDPREPRPPAAAELGHLSTRDIRANGVHATESPQPALSLSNVTAKGSADLLYVPPSGGTRDNVIVPQFISLRATVIRDVAEITLTQVFNSETAAIGKTTYKLSLPQGWTVTGFRFSIGGKTHNAKIGPKKKARGSFEEALDKDWTAAIVEQEERDIITATLGNIPAGTKFEVELSFITLVSADLILGSSRRARSLT